MTEGLQPVIYWYLPIQTYSAPDEGWPHPSCSTPSHEKGVAPAPPHAPPLKPSKLCPLPLHTGGQRPEQSCTLIGRFQSRDSQVTPELEWLPNSDRLSSEVSLVAGSEREEPSLWILPAMSDRIFRNVCRHRDNTNLVIFMKECSNEGLNGRRLIVHRQLPHNPKHYVMMM